MLFFIFITILVIGVVFYNLSNWSKLEYGLRENFSLVGIIGLVIGILTVSGSIFILLFCYIPKQAELESYEIQRASLVYQYENDFYNNDNDIGKRELMSEIQKYNQDLVWHKRLQRDIWVGIYYANIYDDLELIDISSKRRCSRS